MKIFISSVIAGFEQYRDAAVQAVRAVRHDVIRAEDFTASPRTPQQVCLKGVREADLVLLLLGERYGEVQASGKSATHEEFGEARERCEILVFVQEGVKPEAAQHRFLSEVQKWATGRYTNPFSSPDDLRNRITAAIRDLEVSHAAGGVNEAELGDHARSLFPSDRGRVASLALVTVGGPRQQVLRPAKLEDAAFQRWLRNEALTGEDAVLSTEEGTNIRVKNDVLLLEQESSSVSLNQAGDVRVLVPATKEEEREYFPSLIEENVRELLHTALRFTVVVLNRIDPVQRLARVVPVAGLVGAGYMGWRMQEQAHRNSKSVQLNMRSGDTATVTLSPPSVPRPLLGAKASELAEDLMVLLRRELKA